MVNQIYFMLPIHEAIMKACVLSGHAEKKMNHIESEISMVMTDKKSQLI